MDNVMNTEGLVEMDENRKILYQLKNFVIDSKLYISKNHDDKIKL